MEYIIGTYEYMEEEGIHGRLALKFSGKIIQIFRSGKLNIAMEAMAHSQYHLKRVVFISLNGSFRLYIYILQILVGGFNPSEKY